MALSKYIKAWNFLRSCSARLPLVSRCTCPLPGRLSRSVSPLLQYDAPPWNAYPVFMRHMASSTKDNGKTQVPDTKKQEGQQHKVENRATVSLRSMRECMKVGSMPTAAFGLGLAGAIPFILLTPPFHQVLPEVLSSRPMQAQAAYGAVILSFLGGPHWGLAMVRTHAPPNDRIFFINISTFRFIWSVIPSLLSWPALLLPDIQKMTMLTVSFALVLGMDTWCTKQGLLPQWYLPLRVLLSVVVILSLTSSTLQVYLGSKRTSLDNMMKD